MPKIKEIYFEVLELLASELPSQPTSCIPILKRWSTKLLVNHMWYITSFLQIYLKFVNQINFEKRTLRTWLLKENQLARKQ